MLLTPVSACAFTLENSSEAAQWAERHPGLSTENGYPVGT